MKDKEIWKDIQGYNSLYQCSNLGRVKSLPRKVRVRGKFGNIRTIKGRILTPFQDGENYLHVTLIKNNHKKDCLIHRLVAKAFLPNKSPKTLLQVDHIDGNVHNNTVNNLRWCTPEENESYSLRRRHIRAHRHLISQRIILISKTDTSIFPSFAAATRYIKSIYHHINFRTTVSHLSRIASSNSNRIKTHGFTCMYYDPKQPITEEKRKIQQLRKKAFASHPIKLNNHQKQVKVIQGTASKVFNNSTQAAKWVKKSSNAKSKLVTIRNSITACCRKKRKHAYGFKYEYLK